MNIPSPAMLKKQADDRKAREAELASSLASAKETLPPTKGETKRRESSGKPVSTTSSSLRTDKASKGRSSNSSTRTPSHSDGSRKPRIENSKRKESTPSTRSSRGTTGSTESRNTSGSTSTTPRKKSSTQPGKTTKPGTPSTKKPFERPEHLTQRPLRDNEALQKLRAELEKPARGQFKRAYRTNARQSGKNTALKNMKENS